MSTRVSATSFARFCCLPPREQVDGVKEMIANNLRKGGPSYWQPAISAYRRWLRSLFATKGDCIRDLESRCGKNDQRTELLRLLLAGDRLSGGLVHGLGRRSVERHGFRIVVNPDFGVKLNGANYILKFAVTKQEPLPSAYGQTLADLLHMAFMPEVKAGAVVSVVAPREGLVFTAQRDQRLADAQVSGNLMILGGLWQVLRPADTAMDTPRQLDLEW